MTRREFFASAAVSGVALACGNEETPPALPETPKPGEGAKPARPPLVLDFGGGLELCAAVYYRFRNDSGFATQTVASDEHGYSRSHGRLRGRPLYDHASRAVHYPEPPRHATTNTSCTNLVGPERVLEAVIRKFGDVANAAGNVLTVRVGDQVLCTLDNAVLTSMTGCTAEGMWCGELGVAGVWREWKLALEKEAADRAGVEKQNAVAAKTEERDDFDGECFCDLCSPGLSED